LANDDVDHIPELIEVSQNADISSNSTLNTIFSDEALATNMAKVDALETLLSLSVRDCSFNDFIREVLMVFLKVVKCEAGSVLEVDQANQSLFFRAVVGSSSDRVVNFVIPFGQGIVGHVMESRLALVVDNVPENKVHLKSVEKAIGFETRNLIALPIIIRGNVYGVLELLNRVGENNFTAADVDLLTYVCHMASKTIEIRLMISWTRQQVPQGEAA
jgi:putative methionine-R-sulfoxide reductase with GAF domain